MDFITTMYDKNKCLKRIIMFGVLVLLSVCIALGCAIFHLYHYKHQYEQRLDADNSYNACCARSKCTAKWWQDRLGGGK